MVVTPPLQGLSPSFPVASGHNATAMAIQSLKPVRDLTMKMNQGVKFHPK